MTQAAKKLRLSQSTLSEQLKQFESIIGQELFLRNKQRLTLSESGKIAFDYAERIFSAGEEMMGVFQGVKGQAQSITLKVGAVGPLSKNFQFEFLKPVLESEDVKTVVTANSLKALLPELGQHKLDLILSGYPVQSSGGESFHSDFLGRVGVCIVGVPPQKKLAKNFPHNLEGVPLFLPTKESRVRAEFDTILERAGVRPQIKAEVEDMALLRVFALSGQALALVPEIVVYKELQEKRLVRVQTISEITEKFYVISAPRKFPHPLISELIKSFRARLKQEF